ncbi:hypothetical protein [Algibacter luteus]|uniref:hypothetical protein n=1 Tax=Algibacter luteus TaxID=1178825 RepID=UPI002598BA58|nr:hypothetical protein [Algibacter luteus]WJJ95535.1 hypothetical protein O5O44_09900 [Algibacter luteus]
MKNLTKLFLLAILVVFASCQNETLTEGASSIVEDELAMEDEILVSDGEEDTSFVLDSNSEIMPTRELSFSLSSNSTQEGTPIPSSCTPDLEALELSLPDVANVTVTSKPGVDSYFTIDILDSSLAGTGIAAWCVDQDLSLYDGDSAEFSVYSSYETLPAGEFEYPENFDLINWVINQNFVGQASASGGNYTFGHVQYAMWLLVDDSVCVECSALAAPGEASWTSNAAVNVAMAQEIADAAIANGQDFVPGCGQKVGVILNPAGKQAIMIAVDVPEKEEECSDCEGKVTKLELEFDWRCDKYIKIYQRKENTCYGVKIFSQMVKAGETFTIEGANHDGTFGRYAYIYINGCYYTKIKTNCDINIGPGYTKGVFNVISGESSIGGELCEYVKPDYNKCYRHWSCRYYSKCRYSYSGH